MGVYPDLKLDYAAIRISDGNLMLAGTMSAVVAAGELTVTWSTQLNEMAVTMDDDRVYILLYQPEVDEFITTAVLPTRADGQVVEVLPAHFLGGKGYVWIFFSDRKVKRVSRTSYLGGWIFFR
ncbi:DUF6266 family protein [Sphingobacterium sp. xlx-130]|uniref:DUF6266 family protein n=1 Tax=Sphingobacterium sp. xlx-130 TaxID=2654323 RepID=UPI0013DB5858|nr:DUF6266 family protein [Sphingobacterium sp. xlx-130]